MEYVESVIVGGGQAGLAVSYFLSQEGREHLVLEKSSRAANVWESERWDSFTLATPNWTVKMPGTEIDEKNREGFMPRNEIVEFFNNYVERFQLPLSYNTPVSSVEQTDHGYMVKTKDRTFKSKNVVVATGFFQQPKVPLWALNFSPRITQIHATRYRNPGTLPPGAVLVVGTGQSGCQIAEELYLEGRKVFLSTGGAGRVLRRYRGKDIVEWLDQIHFFDLTPDMLPPGQGRFDPVPHVSGTKGGHNLNLHQFARDGVILLGKLTNAENQKAFFAPNLYDNLRKSDEFDFRVRNMIDAFVNKKMLDAPLEHITVLSDGYDQPVANELDLKKENINTVIWAGGYSYDYSLVKLPVYDSDGFPEQVGGVTSFPGLYFVGLPWLPSNKSGFLLGVAENARYIALNILEEKPDSMPEKVS